MKDRPWARRPARLREAAWNRCSLPLGVQLAERVGARRGDRPVALDLGVASPREVLARVACGISAGWKVIWIDDVGARTTIHGGTYPHLVLGAHDAIVHIIEVDGAYCIGSELGC